MLVQLATIPGRDDRPNEDFPAALPDCAVLLDGAGGPAEMPTGCVHGTDWYVRQLGVRLLAWMGSSTWCPDGARWPRAKRHDDAAIVCFSSPELAWRTA
jgi:hypothetical protein